MPLTHISKTDAIMVSCVAASDVRRSLLGEFMRYAENTKVSTEAKFIGTMVNDGITALPDDTQKLLLEWVHKKIMSGKMSAVDAGRRHFMKLSSKTLFAGLTYSAVDIPRDPAQGYSELAAAGSLAAAFTLAERRTLECDEVFRTRLTEWMKEKHQMDVTFPSPAKRGAAR